MIGKHLDIRELISLIKSNTSTDYTEALIEGLKIAMELNDGEITVKIAFKQILKGSQRFVDSRSDGM